MTEKQIARLKNVILYILKDFSGGADYIKLYKLLYFANKQQLAEVGVPIITDRFKAWDLGPVPSLTGYVVKQLEEHKQLHDQLAVFNGAIKVRKNKLVKATEEPDSDSIPPHTRELLDSLITKYKHYSAERLSQLSHDEAWRQAYESNGNGTESINPVAMAKVCGASTDMQICVDRLFSHNPDFISILDDQDDTIDSLESSAFEVFQLKNMEYGWDGEDAEKIDSQTADNCRLLLSLAKSQPKLIELVYPTPSGTLCIDWRHKKAKVSAELSQKHMAFYYVSADKKDVFDSPIMKFGEESFESLFHYIGHLKDSECRYEG